MKRTEQPTGFTIVEMLTVMGIIAVLIGLLIPALSQVKDYSKQIQQKAQFHSIKASLEMFKAEFGNYPETNDNSLVPVKAIDNTAYCGANKLAEALAGWDLLGFHPKSGFTANGVNDIDGDNTTEMIYNPVAGFTSSSGTYTETAKQNIENRKKYIDLENANAFQMKDIYSAYAPLLARNFVLGDVYAKTRVSGKKIGMPILYFRARTSYQFQDYLTTDPVSGLNDDIYNINDNVSLLNLGLPEDSTIKHPIWDGVGTDLKDFEDMILNKQVQSATITAANPNGVKRPYRVDSYILISAGKDGLYGTADDVFNFDKGTEQ